MDLVSIKSPVQRESDPPPPEVESQMFMKTITGLKFEHIK